MVNLAVNTGGQKILDATQQAVVGVVDEMETVIQETTDEYEGHEPFYMSGEFWVAMAFVLVVVCLFVPLKKALSAFLDKYIQKEISRIANAEILKDEARRILADYEQKLENMAAETKEISEKAEKRAEMIEKKELKDLDDRLISQEKSVRDRVSAELVYAEKELSSVVIEKSFSMLEKKLKQKADDVFYQKLIDESIRKIAVL